MPVALFSAPVKKYVPENFINIKVGKLFHKTLQSVVI